MDKGLAEPCWVDRSCRCVQAGPDSHGGLWALRYGQHISYEPFDGALKSYNYLESRNITAQGELETTGSPTEGAKHSFDALSVEHTCSHLGWGREARRVLNIAPPPYHREHAMIDVTHYATAMTITVTPPIAKVGQGVSFLGFVRTARMRRRTPMPPAQAQPNDQETENA